MVVIEDGEYEYEFTNNLLDIVRGIGTHWSSSRLESGRRKGTFSDL